MAEGHVADATTTDVDGGAAGPRSLADVARHFLSTRDDLLDPDEDDLLDGLDEGTALEIVRREYVSGTCAAYAVALHDRMGLPIVGLNGGMHVAVLTADGRILDFLGASSVADACARYGMSPVDPVAWTREEAVGHVRMDAGDPDPDADADPWDEISIARWTLERLRPAPEALA